MDFSYLHSIRRYDGGLVEELVEDMDVDAAIEQLSREMSGISIDRIPFDQWDFITVFCLGLVESACDYLLGDPKKGLSKALSSDDNKFGRWLRQIHEKLPHRGHSIDISEDGKSGRYHRATSRGHDLAWLLLAIYEIHKGIRIGGLPLGTWRIDKVSEGMPLPNAIVAYLVHMVADFCSASSLPVPFFPILATLGSKDVERILTDMYSKGYNLRHMFVQAFPVALVEVLMRIYNYARTRDLEASSEARDGKLNKLLLMAHGLAEMVNIGKVVICKDPTLINLPMLLRVISLVWSVVKDEANVTHRASVKANLAVIRTKYQTIQTAILLDKSIFYTREICQFVRSRKDGFRARLEANDEHASDCFGELDKAIADFSRFNEELSAEGLK